ncbi:MAG: hypothetical protein IT332_04830 [Ardenticatenales bacterium]|nr:hypothetical protein [Ardenticatenales bacterium]
MDDDAITRRISDAIAGDDTDAFPPGMSEPSLRALAGAGYTHLSQLTGATAKELLALHGMGPKGIRILGEALAAAGLSFAGADGREARGRS